MRLRAEARRWHGHVPAGWAVRRFKYLASVREGQVDPEAPLLQELPLFAPNHIESGTGRVVGVESAQDQGAESGKYLVDEGDIIYSKIRPALRKVAIAPCSGLCSADMYPIRSGPSLEARFLFYSMLGEGFFRYSLLESNRVAMPKINREALGQCVLLVPPRPEQRAISDFLDRKTTAIDALVVKKHRMVDLIDEQRRALVARTVATGLNPEACTKPSGVEWLGKVPRHWNVKAIKWDSPVKRGASPRPIDDPKYFDDAGTYGWVRILDVTASDGRLTTTEQRLSELGCRLSVRLDRGQLFLSIAGTVGKACITAIKCCIHDGFVYFPRLSMNPRYLKYIFDAGEAYKGLGKLGTQLNLNTDTVGSIRIPYPPKEEQEAIVQFLDRETSRLKAAVAKIRHQIALLREHRQALVTAAVTGQLDVTVQKAA